ncbi:hypothetical protein BH10BAC3_BH10BAC3_32440 [soil metagenome]
MRTRLLYLTLILWGLAPSICFPQCPISSLGQNPSTAFPVCGTNNFVQASVNLCGGKTVPSIKCNTTLLTDVNPYWYKFTCVEAGTLGFTIQPNSNQSDYDWQVFDVTGHSADDVFTDKTLTVSSNWSQYFGNTGTTTTAANIFECEGPVPQNSKMPSLIKGHDYLLLVSHFSNTQAGYKLNFGGGTASITDTTRPKLKSIYATCDAKTLGIKLNKPMKCSSLAANGSDFKLKSSLAVIIGATSVECGSGFDMDSISLTLSAPLPAGKYVIVVAKGTDGNTLLDYCDHPLPVGDTISITLLPSQPTPMDSMQPVPCRPTGLNLVFNDPMLCSSIAADGSDFKVTGPSPVTVTAASGSCSAGSSRSIVVQLSAPIEVGGLYTITLQKGTDANTLINDCAKETPAGSSVTFRAYYAVSADINYTISSSCINDTIKLYNSGRVEVSSWKWYFEDGISNTREVQKVYASGTKTFALKVSNGVCTDSGSISVSFDKNRVKAAFISPAFVCPLDTAFFENTSTGPITSWLWNFGNGFTSQLQQPPYQFYPAQVTLQRYTSTLYVTAANGCTDSLSQDLQVPGNCYIAVPTAFTPNGDGLNDFLFPINAYKAINLDFKVYNRYGQIVWHTTDWTRKWDGRISGNLQASGTYIWHLTYTDSDKGKNKKIDLKGTTSLIR